MVFRFPARQTVRPDAGMAAAPPALRYAAQRCHCVVASACSLACSQEVKTILGDGFPFEVTSRGVDLPELQGEPDEVAREKCRLASEEVRSRRRRFPAPLTT